MIIIHTSSCLPPLARLSTTHCARESVFKANQPSWWQGDVGIFIRRLRNGWMELMYERDLNGRLRVNGLWFKNQPRFCQVIVEGEKNARVGRKVSALTNGTSRFLEFIEISPLPFASLSWRRSMSWLFHHRTQTRNGIDQLGSPPP